MFNSILMVKASKVAANTTLKSGKVIKADKNRLDPIFLTPVAGKLFNRNFISGTVAQRAGIVDGKTYLAQQQEVAFDEKNGRQFRWTILKEVDAMEIIQGSKLLGEVVMLSTEEVEATAEKTVASEKFNG